MRRFFNGFSSTSASCAAALIAPRLAGRTTAQFWLTAGVAVLAPLPFGSVGLFWIALWVVLLSVACLLGSFADFNPRQFRLLCLFLLVVAAYASVAIIQILPAPDWLPTNPIWSEASKLLDTPLAPRVSVRGSIPTIALGSLLLFTLAFTNGFLIGGNADRSVALFRLLAYSARSCGELNHATSIC